MASMFGVWYRLVKEALVALPPEGWREGFDDKTGAPYYCNLSTVRNIRDKCRGMLPTGCCAANPVYA